jgi:hypothetical protein
MLCDIVLLSEWFPSILKDCSAFVFTVKQSKKNSLPHPRRLACSFQFVRTTKIGHTVVLKQVIIKGQKPEC